MCTLIVERPKGGSEYMRLFPKFDRIRFGYSPICQKNTVFLSRYDWLRDHYRCQRCKSLPRYRAVIDVLERHFPNWRDLSIHESSPHGPASDMLDYKKECSGKFTMVIHSINRHLGIEAKFIEMFISQKL